jgi:DNA repair protein RadC
MFQAASPPVKKTLSIRELPRLERPRERLWEFGEQMLSVAELLAILIGSGGGGRSALDVAQAILAYGNGSLERIAREPASALMQLPGVGEAGAARVRAALELGRRVERYRRDEKAPLRSPRDVYDVFAPRLRDLPVEELHVGLLDTQCRLERTVLVTRGILNSSLVHPREIFREVVVGEAAAIVLVHNHPSGDPTPSTDDREATEQVAAAGNVLGIPLRDHVIIGRGRYLSFAEAGYL